MDVAYCNPRPINVSKAEASQEGATTKVFLALRDGHYPGSTSTLTYDAASDQLTGVYDQAALQQPFAVVFVRMKESGIAPSRLQRTGARHVEGPSS